MIKCYRNRIIVKDVQLDEKVVSILIIPKDKDLITGTVIAFGSDVDEKIAYNDILYYRPYSGTMVDIDADKFRSLDESEIVAGWNVNG
jgi:co-chaperonin GroES (HSP10)